MENKAHRKFLAKMNRKRWELSFNERESFIHTDENKTILSWTFGKSVGTDVIFRRELNQYFKLMHKN